MRMSLKKLMSIAPIFFSLTLSCVEQENLNPEATDGSSLKEQNGAFENDAFENGVTNKTPVSAPSTFGEEAKLVGDMVLSKNQYDFMFGGKKKFDLFSFNGLFSLWSGRIPYKFEKGFMFEKEFTDIVKEFNTKMNNAELVPAEGDEFHILVTNKLGRTDGACGVSPLGKVRLVRENNQNVLKNYQILWIRPIDPANPNPCDPIVKGTIYHELWHALGVAHEHQRPDRDNHITIAGTLSTWLQKIEDTMYSHEGKPYDLKAITHYSSSQVTGLGATMTDKNGNMVALSTVPSDMDWMYLDMQFNANSSKNCPNGMKSGDGEYIDLYQSSVSEMCADEKTPAIEACVDGTVYRYAINANESVAPGLVKSCTAPVKSCGTVVHGDSETRVWYKAATDTSDCSTHAVAQTRTCDDGQFGEYLPPVENGFATCEVVAQCEEGESETRVKFLQRFHESNCEEIKETQTRSCLMGQFSDWTGTYSNNECDIVAKPCSLKTDADKTDFMGEGLSDAECSKACVIGAASTSAGETFECQNEGKILDISASFAALKECSLLSPEYKPTVLVKTETSEVCANACKFAFPALYEESEKESVQCFYGSQKVGI